MLYYYKNRKAPWKKDGELLHSSSSLAQRLETKLQPTYPACSNRADCFIWFLSLLSVLYKHKELLRMQHYKPHYRGLYSFGCA